MFKRIIYFSAIACFLTVTSFVMAQDTTTESASPASSIDTEKVKALKEKLATKVAQLRENQTRGFYGEITTLSKTSFTLVTKEKEIKIRYSDDTLVFKIAPAGKSEAKITDVKNSLSASVLGLYDPESSILTANIILIQTYPVLISGEITSVDKPKATISLKTTKDKSENIEYEKTTASSEYQKEGKLVKSGLSRFSVGDRLYAWINSTAEDDGNTKMNAVKILRIPKNILNPAAPESSPEESPSASPKSKSSPKSSPAANSSPES